MVKNTFDPTKPDRLMVRLVWQISENMDDGRPFIVKKDYTASLHEKASLRHDLESWRGRPFTFDEEVGFDLSQIVGAPCMLNLVERIGQKGGRFTNISAIMPLAKGMTNLHPRDYERVKDRPKPPAPKPPSHIDAPPQFDADDSDVPF